MLQLFFVCFFSLQLIKAAEYEPYQAPIINHNDEDPKENYQEWLKMQKEAQAKAAQQVLDLEWSKIMQEDQSDDEEDQEREEAKDVWNARLELEETHQKRLERPGKISRRRKYFKNCRQQLAYLKRQ
ncbi:MAG: hypothetical protein EBU90_16450 [Proteobacteria bacterium]|nr:hypothetical protein [Pseudomonadota bacterium]NBP14347.1 hypothetical protein [bacterium]